MKKVLVLLTILFFVTGCSSMKSINDFDTTISEIKNIISYENTFSNAYGKGFKYYKPRDFSILEDNGFNQILLHEYNKYYLSLDVNAYYYKYKNDFVKENDDLYFSGFSYGDINGYVRIKQISDYFYVKMMYNYSYVEVRVKTLHEAFDSAIDEAIILSSIKYNDKIIALSIENDEVSYSERKYELVEPKSIKKDKQNILEYYEGELLK